MKKLPVPFLKLLCQGICLAMTIPFTTLAQMPINDAAGILSPNDTVLKLQTTLDNVYVCPNKKEVYLYIDLEGCSLGKRIPLNISVVFDRSGSMEGERIRYGKTALEYLIDHLEPIDNASIVIYDHLAEVLHGSTPVTNKEHLKKKLEHIRPRGATSISAGLELGYAEVKSTYDNNKINKIFLMSDGIPNEGITDPYLLERMVKVFSSKNNISLSSFGLGHEFDEVLMHDLAEAGGGNYYYIASPEDAARDFVSEIKTLLSVVAKRTSLSVEFPSDYLELSKVYGQHSTVAGDMIFIDLKEVHPNETNGILLKFNILQPVNSTLVFNTSLAYDNVLSDVRMIQRRMNTIAPTKNVDSCSRKTNDSVLEKIVYFTSNDLLESAIKDAENHNIASAKNKIQTGKNLISSGNAGESPMLDRQYKALDDYEKHLNNWSSKDENEIKRLH
ncbi:MAG TPA: VWA domain-containing protein, partial [Cytophagaceae bacterium]|nr:VWA domain-containing protein [Cytophagaceae bacterium]